MHTTSPAFTTFADFHTELASLTWNVLLPSNLPFHSSKGLYTQKHTLFRNIQSVPCRSSQTCWEYSLDKFEFK